MKVMVYCQHVLGIGHLCRIMLILQQLKEHRITLVLGGPPITVSLPDHVQVVQLPGLKMDKEFSGLLSVIPGQDVETIKERRTAQLLAIFAELKPDLLLVELFPFGRNAFSFELMPLLAKAGQQNNCRVACSVRDILVERDNTLKFEQRVIERLNEHFHLLLIHGDPDLIKLDETFSRMGDINIPVSYTGYICQPPSPGDRDRLRRELQMEDNEQLIVVSAGSGSVGLPLLKAAVHALPLLETKNCRLQVFTGPYTAEHDFNRLAAAGSSRIHLERFSDNFPAWLAAADLSVSMGGYNTTMNLVAAGCRALVYPFVQNHEQRMRAEGLAQKKCLQLLAETDLVPAVLADRISAALAVAPRPAKLMLDGAARTAKQLAALARAEAVS